MASEVTLSYRKLGDSQRCAAIRNKLDSLLIAKVPALLGEEWNLSGGASIFLPIKHFPCLALDGKRSVLHIPWI